MSLDRLLLALAAWITHIISEWGYTGIVLLMAIESACIPLPSEIIMPFAGFLVFKGVFSWWGVATAGALGCVLGSIPAYYLGLWGGRAFILRYGRYVFLSAHDLERAEHWFARYGNWAVFWARLLPAIRTFIALPAGILRMPMLPFILYTFVGSWIWCAGLAYLGIQLGEHWKDIQPYFHPISYALLAFITLVLIRHIAQSRHTHP